jgi:hypothetical protein
MLIALTKVFRLRSNASIQSKRRTGGPLTMAPIDKAEEKAGFKEMGRPGTFYSQLLAATWVTER